MRKIALVLTVMVVLGGGVALGEVPAVLNFTGSLSTGAGPYEGPANVTLAFYPDQTTATPLWSEQQEIYVQGGRFYVLLGTDPANPLPASLFDGEDLFLGIRVDDSPEITPRLRVTSVPYAMRAADAGLLGGLPPSAFSLEGHTHAFGDLTGQVGESQLPDSVVLEAELTDILGGYVTLETFNAALAGKSDVGHLHGIGDVTGLQEALDSKAAADHDHDAAYVNVGEADSVTSVMVVDGTLTFADLGANGCVAGQVIKRGATAWECGDDLDTTYTAGTGLTLSPTNQFSVVQGTIEDWARGVCYDTPAELESALPGWDQDASNDLTTATTFGGDVTGTYNNLEIAAGAVGSAEIADSTVFASVQDEAGVEHFAVTDGSPGLGFVGAGATTVSFDPGTHQVTIASTDTNSGGTVTSVGLSMPAQFTVSGSPVTTSGTLTATWTSQAANTVLAAPDGSNGAPGFRALVAADIPGLDASKIVSGTLSTDRFSAYADLVAEGKIGPGSGQVAAGDHDHVTFWRIDGNAGTDPSTHYLGTSDNQALELRTNGKRALRLEPEASVAVGGITVTGMVHLGGWAGNWVTSDAIGATISGGGGMVDHDLKPNRVTDLFGTVGGGIDNQAGDDTAGVDSAWFATVGGGIRNIASGPFTSVGGGLFNMASGQAATVSGGHRNAASVDYASVGGGAGNEASSSFSTVGGGIANKASGIYSTVGGGAVNSAIGGSSTVAGGHENQAHSDSATVGGGGNNWAQGSYATVPGGWMNWAAGDLSFTAGHYAWAFNQGCFVWGDSTNDVVSCSMANQWVARASGGVYFYTSSDLSSGSYLPAGGSSWQTLSDRHQKTDLEPVDVGEVLECLAGMPITTWRYVSEESGARHMGPMAQDFYACYGLGDSERHISTIDADGVAFAAIQALNQKVEALTIANQALTHENQELRAQISGLSAQNSELQAQIRGLAAQNSELQARVDRLERLLGSYLRSRDGRGR